MIHQKKKVEFVSLKPNKQKYMYVDQLFMIILTQDSKKCYCFLITSCKVLKPNGYEVVFCKKFTDIDDKLSKRMKRGKSLEEITTFI